MGVLIIIIVLVILLAHKSRRPIKLVLTPEEAKSVKARWWRLAKTELKVWAIVFVLGYALVGNALAAEHWKWYVYVFIVWCSLMLCSRLAVWATAVWVIGCFAAAYPAHFLLRYDIPTIVAGPPLIALVFAIIIRAVGFIVATAPQTPRSETQPQPARNPFEHPHPPEYDWDTDTWLFENGHRGPAHIRYPMYGKSHKDRDLD